jgi:ABC-type polysaccharide/polyol phosphate transport system ATPase subunit
MTAPSSPSSPERIAAVPAGASDAGAPPAGSPADRAQPAGAAVTGAPALLLEDVHKSFRLPHQRYSTLKERVLHPFRAREYEELRAVDGVSVEIAEGEFFGVVGRNGSGKSTLLKCLAGIYPIDSGRIDVNGRLSPFIELGVGFNPELSARENVVINAIMLGLSRRQARERFDEIIAFAELEEFVDLKLKNYSSGMSVRLAFAVAIQVDAEILVVDEVLAVGDAAFQQKCFEQFHRMKEERRTIVFVTHDMSAVERFCDRAMLIERGVVQMIDEPARIGRAYNELNFGGLVHERADGDRSESHPEAEILDCWFEDAAGERVSATAQGERMAIGMEVRFHADITDPIFAVTLRNVVRHTVFATSTVWEREQTGSFSFGDSVLVRIELENWLAPGHYDATPSVARAGAGADALDLREDLASLTVHATRFSGGVVDLPHSIAIERT